MPFRFSFPLMLFLPVLSWSQTTYYWAGDAHDPTIGGSGNWHADPSWSSTAAGYTAAAWANGTNNAILGGTNSGVVTLNGYGVSGSSLTLQRDFSINTQGNVISFQTLAWADSATTLSLTGGGSLSALISSGTIIMSGAGTTLQLGGTHVVSGGVVEAGDGTYLLNANQGTNMGSAAVVLDGTATLRVLGGTVGLGSLTSAASGTGVVENGHGIRSGQLNVNQASGSSTYTGIIRDNSSGPQTYAYLRVIKDGPGTWILGGAPKTHTGGTAIYDGGLQLAAADVLPATGTVSLGLMGTSQAGTLSLAGYDQLIGGLDGSYAGTSVDLGSATLKVGGFPASNLGASFAGSIVGSGGLVKTGLGLQTLSGVNTFSGGTTVEGGTLMIGNSTAFGTGPVLFKAGTTFRSGISSVPANITLESGDIHVSSSMYSTQLAGILGGGARLIFDGGGVFTLTGTNTYGGGTVASATLVIGSDHALGDPAGGLTLNNGKLQWTQAFDLAPTRAITVTGFGTLLPNAFTTTITQAISGTGTLGLDSSGTVVLSGNNTFSGGLTIGNQGTVAVNSDTALGATGGAVTLGAGTLRFMSSMTVDASRTLQIATGTPSGGTIKVDDGVIVTVPQSIIPLGSGSAQFIKDGPGTLILGAPAAYNGGTSVKGGVMKLVGGDNTLPAGQPLTLLGGRLDLNGTSQTVATLTAGSSAVDLNGGTLVMTATFDTTFAAGFVGTGMVRKTGGGRFDLGGSGEFAGTFQLEAGSLALGGTLASASQLELGNGTYLYGAGTAGRIVAGSGATISPGFNNGLNTGLLKASGVTLAAGAHYVMGSSNLSDIPGVSADLLAIDGTLDIGGTAVDPVVFALVSLNGSSAPGAMPGFDDTHNLAKTLVTTTSGITGITADNVVLDLTGFQNSYVGEFHLRMSNGGKDLMLVYWSTSFDLWSDQYFTPEELADANISGPSADPDGDGLTNLLEYALDLGPKAVDTTGLPEAGSTATDWTYTYTRPANR
ncbi:MAG: autotransporter-associated beta strand repeat-containing protein, partial [Cephaloticoccus sp.]|nr:autotransporter-associated beta strand repeat-containing protein [Cephaloticoccus sp.]